eukprot:6179089-Pleurochrysis_carterae.AAC.7
MSLPAPQRHAHAAVARLAFLGCSSSANETLSNGPTCSAEKQTQIEALHSNVGGQQEQERTGGARWP